MRYQEQVPQDDEDVVLITFKREPSGHAESGVAAFLFLRLEMEGSAVLNVVKY
jgi:hypothetical protein